MTDQSYSTHAAALADQLLVEGARVPIWQAGELSASEAIVFVHGLPGSGEEFLGLLGHVASLGRAIAFDLPGFGKAGKPSDFDYTTAGFGRVIEHILDELNVTDAHLVLHDFGGGFALEWALRRPHALRSVVLMNTGLLGMGLHWLPKIWRTPVLGRTAQLLAHLPLTRMLLWHGNPRGLPKSFVDNMYRNYDRGTQAMILKLYRDVEHPVEMVKRLEPVIAPLDVPALVIWGMHDPYISKGAAERARLLFPSAELMLFHDSGHWPFIDNHERTLDALMTFLGRQLNDA